MILSVVTGYYANKIREAAERIGAALEASRRLRFWQSQDKIRRDLFSAWSDFERASNELHEYVEAVEKKANNTADIAIDPQYLYSKPDGSLWCSCCGKLGKGEQS